MEYIPYNSRSTVHKSKFGALEQGESVTVKVVLPRNIGCTGVDLVIDRDGEDQRRFAFFWLSMQGEGEEWWQLSYTAECPGLYFYHFEYRTAFGSGRICHRGDCLGRLENAFERFQLTVYEKGFTTPDWMKGTVMYQIFPDRFFCSGQRKSSVASDRILRDDWGGQPAWRPNENGRVLNNDYFGGDLKGIEQKLEYLKSLGVGCIYLNPIFEANSNHRYDTADYLKIDPLLGTQSDFAALCKRAGELNIKIILDGVFSHTGDDSVYFNKYSRYNTVGAYQSKSSRYFSWYKFTSWPNGYHSWWGIDILPEVEETSPDFMDFITGENAVIEKWIRLGAGGWRLDVADELPDEFIDRVRAAVKRADPNALLLGEVWEDASNKCSYSKRRRYLQGRQLDSVMNYPFAQAIMDFIRTGRVEGFTDKILLILENYPKCVVDVLMNHIGTHDTMRAITALAGESCEYRDRQWQSKKQLDEQQYQKGLRLLRLASLIQYTLPGVPSLYYGDEAGMQGYKDPFNRCCYPWGRENEQLLQWYRALGAVRAGCGCLKDGEFCTVSEMLGCLAFERKGKKDEILVIVNRNEHEIDYYLPERWHGAQSMLGGQMQQSKIRLDALEGAIIKKEKAQ